MPRCFIKTRHAAPKQPGLRSLLIVRACKRGGSADSQSISWFCSRKRPRIDKAPPRCAYFWELARGSSVVCLREASRFGARWWERERGLALNFNFLLSGFRGRRCIMKWCELCMLVDNGALGYWFIASCCGDSEILGFWVSVMEIFLVDII